ncbi:MAG: hypothetical protein AAGB12_03370, partial [Pseudomonadota bacterium]
MIQRASIVNQARLHAGYHYPRSIATARTSDTFIDRFSQEFAHCINDEFTHYYAIASRGSLTDAQQFKHFCDYLKLPCESIEDHPAFNYAQLAAVYKAQEPSFDPLLLAEEYRKRVGAMDRIKVLTEARLLQASISEHRHYRVIIEH